MSESINVKLEILSFVVNVKKKFVILDVNLYIYKINLLWIIGNVFDYF